jgi:hypothetical protein
MLAMVELPPCLSGMAGLGSKGAAVLAPEMPKAWQIMATSRELKVKFIESANSCVEVIE